MLFLTEQSVVIFIRNEYFHSIQKTNRAYKFFFAELAVNCIQQMVEDDMSKEYFLP